MRTRTTKRLVVLAAGFLLALSANAQLAMTRTTFTAAYTPISTGTGATLSTASGDDAVQTGIPIGFTFNYLGTNYTTIGATTNGAAGFVGMTNTRFNTDLFTATAPNAILAPWWDDLNVASGVGSMLYQTQGTPGSQTFTMQWTDTYTYYTGSTALMNFQIILYEGTNVIEYRYGAQPTGTFNPASESASIGMKSATGGNGQYLDAVTGSAFTGNGMLNAGSSWPTHNFRFTPGAPTALAAGTYTVGNAGTYFNLSEAVADINHRGVSGAVVLSLIDATYDASTTNGHNFFPILLGPVAGASIFNNITIQPASGTATITSAGAQAGNCVNQTNATAIGTGNEPVFGVIGGQYIGVNNVNFTASGANVDRGLVVFNSSATLGSQFCAFQNIGVTLNRTNTSSIAIEQNLPTTPTSAAGSNSTISYTNLNISNTYNGINLAGNATYPGLSCAIGTTSPTTFNSIGSATANDIGNGGSASYGIQVSNLSGFNIYNNEVRNITTTGSVASEGIIMTGVQGTSSCYMNKIHTIKCTGTGSTSNITGIRGNVTSGANTLRIYNNFIYDLSSGYTGAASATRAMRGIYVQTGGGGTGAETINVDYNNISLNNPAANLSSTCFETGGVTGPVINVRNNIFANFSGTQTAPAAHYAWASPSATATGNTGSISNYNDLYVANAGQGFVGIGSATTYASLANWQAGVTQDANSISSDPGYTNNTSDLHVSLAQLDAAATTSGITWVTTDIDNQSRAVTPDIGADEFTPSALDMGATALVGPVAGACYTSAEPVTIRIKNYAASTVDFSTENVTITVNVTGTITSTISTTLTSGTLASGATQDVLVGTINMSAAGTYTFNAFTTMSPLGDLNTANDAMSPVTISYNAGTVVVTPGSVCQGSSTTLTLSGNTNSSIQWQMSTDGGSTWSNISGATTSPYTDTPGDTTWYRSLMCGSITSTVDTVIWSPTSTPTTVNDTVCGQGTVTLTANGTGTLNWYSVPTGGATINTGSTYTTSVSSTTTFYVESVTGGGTQSVGLFDNSGGGAQQLSGNYEIFDVFQNCTLTGAYVYPGAAGNVICELRDNAGTLITSRTVAVSAADVNQRTYVSLNIPLTPGTNYRLAQGTAGISMFRNASGVSYPYTIPGTISITNSAAGTSFYYFFYDWQILTGCSSGRVPVDAVVIPAAPVTITTSSASVCSGDSAMLTATSTNNGYTYTWTPAGTLNSTTGATVMAGPLTPTTYIVNADSAGCLAADTISIGVNALPTVTMGVNDTLLCIGQSDSLFAINPLLNPVYSSAPNLAVPDAGAPVDDTIAVSLAQVINANTIASVCFDIPHTWDGDLTFTLISPAGTTLDLSSNNGGSGDNYTGTCFSMSASTNITAGAAPFTGSFIPEGAGGFGVFNGENTAGNWILRIQDQAGGDVGTLLDWAISFTPSYYTYSWTSVPAGFTSTSDSVVVSPTVTTQYILVATDTSTGCMRTLMQTVTVNPPLSLAVTGDSLICSSASSTLIGTATGGDGNLSYSWDNGLGTNDTAVATPSTSTLYTLTVTDGCGTPAAIDSILVNVAQPLQLASITNDSTTCAGSPVVLGVTTTNGDGNNTYSWSNSITTPLDSITAGSAGSSATYVVTVMDGCNTMVIDSVTITSFGMPTATVVSNDTTVCTGMTVPVSGMASGGDGNLTYSWTTGTVTPLDSINAGAPGAQVVNVLTVTDGCGQTALDSVIISAFTSPVATASADTSACAGDMLVLSSSATGGDGNTSYLWSNSITTPLDSITASTTTTYVVTVTDGCGLTSSDSVLVTVNTPPTSSFTNSGSGSTFNFTNTSTNANSYLWDFGDSQSSTLSNPSHTYSANGNYTVMLIATNNCGSDTSYIDITVDVGIAEHLLAANVNVFPNPAQNEFSVMLNGSNAGRLTLSLFNIQGQLMQQEELENVKAGTPHLIHVAGYESGMYLLRATTENGSVVVKVTLY